MAGRDHCSSTLTNTCQVIYSELWQSSYYSVACNILDDEAVYMVNSLEDFAKNTVPQTWLLEHVRWNKVAWNVFEAPTVTTADTFEDMMYD